MTKRIAVFFLILSLGGCAAIQNFTNDVKTAYQVVTTSAVTPTQADIAINVFDGAKKTTANYLRLPICGKLPCRQSAATIPIKKAISAGTVARNDIKAFLRANPGENLNIQSVADLQAATSALQAIIKAYNIN